MSGKYLLSLSLILSIFLISGCATQINSTNYNLTEEKFRSMLAVEDVKYILLNPDIELNKSFYNLNYSDVSIKNYWILMFEAKNQSPNAIIVTAIVFDSSQSAYDQLNRFKSEQGFTYSESSIGKKSIESKTSIIFLKSNIAMGVADSEAADSLLTNKEGLRHLAALLVKRT